MLEKKKEKTKGFEPIGMSHKYFGQRSDKAIQFMRFLQRLDKIQAMAVSSYRPKSVDVGEEQGNV